MKRKILILALCLLILLSGCSPKPSDGLLPLHRLVTEITVDYENGPIQATLHYTQDEKMRLILNYLRLIDPYGKPQEDPETADGSLFQITLIHSDGSTKVFRQKADRYLKTEEQPWQCISPQKAMELSILLGYLESDGAQATENAV